MRTQRMCVARVEAHQALTIVPFLLLDALAQCLHKGRVGEQTKYVRCKFLVKASCPVLLFSEMCPGHISENSKLCARPFVRINVTQCDP